MRELNYNLNDTLQKGFFTVNQNYVKDLEADIYSNIYLINGSDISLKNAMLKQIRDAESVVKLCSFIITDEEIVNELITKIQSSSTAVFVLTKLDIKNLTNKFGLSSESADHEYYTASDINSHLANIKLLRDKGVHVRAANDLHAKFIVSDRKSGLIMSANFTTNSLSKNLESGVLLDIDSSKELDNLFDLIYLNGTSYRSFINTTKGKKIFVSETKATLSEDSLFNPVSGLRYTYDNWQNNLFAEIIKIIEEAGNYVFLSSYLIVGLNKIPEFISAVSKAVSKGVDISIFCRAMNNRLDHIEACRTLSDKGCKIFGDFYNHSKGIVSEKAGMIFTANIDGKYGLISSFEVGYVLNEYQHREFLKFHRALINNCLFKFSDKPSRRDFMEYVSLYEMERNLSPILLDKNIEINVNKSCHAFFENSSDASISIGRKREKNGDAFFLILDDIFFEIEKMGSNLTVIKKCYPLHNVEKYLLKYINLKIKLSDE